MPLAPLQYGLADPHAEHRRTRRLVVVGILIPLIAVGLWYGTSRYLTYRRHRQESIDESLEPAAKSGDFNEAERLLRAGARFNQLNQNAVYAAVEQRNSAMLDLLLGHGAKINAGQYSPIIAAFNNDDLPMAEYLISRGADPNGPAGGEPMLVVIADRMDVKYILFLLQHGADPNAQGRYGDRPLHRAVSSNRPASVRVLLDAGAKADVGNDEGDTPLTFASWRNEAKIADDLIAHGAKPTVWSAVAFGNLPQVKKFIEDDRSLVRSADPSHDEKGQTLLYLAAMNDRRAVFDYLLDQGADIHAVTDRRETILHAAVRTNDCPLIRKVLDAGVDVNAKAYDGSTPLHETAWSGALDAARLLLDRGADVELGTESSTPVSSAICYGHPDLAQLFLDHGAKLPPDAMDCAVRYGNLAMVKFVLAHGADADAKNRSGQSPIDVARQREKKAIVDFLAGRKGLKSKSSPP